MDFGFFLKKTIAYFVQPSGMVISLLLLGLLFLYLHKNKYAKISLSLSLSLFLLYAYPPFSNYLVTNLESKYPNYDYRSDVKYIHVLGSGHNTDTTQPLSSRIGGAGIKRNLEGMFIHLKTPNSKIIFTGFEGKSDTTTAKMNATFAITLGIKEENLILNGEAKDTREEALFTKSIIGDEPFILVTSATHMPRAMMLFESLGLHPIAAPTDFHKKKFDGYFKMPSVGSFFKSQIAMHEYMGMLWAKIRG